MDELLEGIEQHLMKHLEMIHVDLEEKGHFVCSQQLDDVKDCVETIQAIHSMKTVKRSGL